MVRGCTFYDRASPKVRENPFTWQLNKHRRENLGLGQDFEKGPEK
jgi:hypothetical protein